MGATPALQTLRYVDRLRYCETYGGVGVASFVTSMLPYYAFSPTVRHLYDTRWQGFPGAGGRYAHENTLDFQGILIKVCFRRPMLYPVELRVHEMY